LVLGPEEERAADIRQLTRIRVKRRDAHGTGGGAVAAPQLRAVGEVKQAVGFGKVRCLQVGTDEDRARCRAVALPEPARLASRLEGGSLKEECALDGRRQSK